MLAQAMDDDDGSAWISRWSWRGGYEQVDSIRNSEHMVGHGDTGLQATIGTP
jgi:hypothetical protein